MSYTEERKLRLSPNQAVIIGGYIVNDFKLGNLALDLGVTSQSVGSSFNAILTKLPSNFFLVNPKYKLRLMSIYGVNYKADSQYIIFADHCVDMFNNYMAFNKEYKKIWQS